MPKITLGITGLYEIWGRDYGIEVPCYGSDLRSAEVTRVERERKLPHLKRIFNIFTKIGFTNAQLCLLACMEARLGSFDLGMDILAT